MDGAKRKCRHFMADFDEIQDKFKEEDFELRDKEMHDYHLEQLEENPELHAHFSKEYGLNNMEKLTKRRTTVCWPLSFASVLPSFFTVFSHAATFEIEGGVLSRYTSNTEQYQRHSNSIPILYTTY